MVPIKSFAILLLIHSSVAICGGSKAEAYIPFSAFIIKFVLVTPVNCKFVDGGSKSKSIPSASLSTKSSLSSTLRSVVNVIYYSKMANNKGLD